MKPMKLWAHQQTIAPFAKAHAHVRVREAFNQLGEDHNQDKLSGLDADQLRQVFMNLALNAVDAAGTGGMVKVSCMRNTEGLHVCVDDSGPGVDVAHRDRLFEPFFTTKAQGSGLGLPISHSIVSQHGGRIEVARSPLGGARFEVILPR